MSRAIPRKTTSAVLRAFAMALAMLLLLCGCSDDSFAAAKPYPSANDDGMLPFEKMPYQRPDMDALEALFSSAADYAEAASARDDLTPRLEQCWDAYDEFYTLETLAMLRSDIDQADEYYAGEYEFFMENEVKVEAWLDRLLVACAASEARAPSRLLAGYDLAAGEPYSDRALELMAREADLLRDYWRVMMQDDIELEGRVQSFSDYISAPLLSDEAYQAANLVYCQACNQGAAPIYIELVKIRRALAEELGFDSYEQFQYEAFARDYTPEQVRSYLDSVAGAMADYYPDFMRTDPYSLVSYDPLSASQLLELLEQTTAHMGRRVTNAYDFMKTYRLYDISASGKKAPGSYTVYLDRYDAPFCYVGAYGDVEDFLDFSHEFGHFADAYVNYNATGSLDLSETYSQAMANLTLLKSRAFLSGEIYQNLLLLHLLANLSIYAEQAAYADFESRVYRLSDEELTVENINALALSCARRFGAVSDGDEELLSLYWAQVTHLFETPFYVISYCVSADAAVQIAELAMNSPGAGIACYEDMLDWKEDSFLSEVERVGLVSPFAPGRAAHNLELVETIMENSLGGYLRAA
ncbi:MAG: hypothetical protein E7426_03235 [Ruminococcaceae bacterium]|nr:hypothetical protein [Oscillospiraceae bacterium]